MTTSITRRTAMLAIASTGAIASASAAALVDVKAAKAAAWDSALREYQDAKAACVAHDPRRTPLFLAGGNDQVNHLLGWGALLQP
jgi:hypothetical protein